METNENSSQDEEESAHLFDESAEMVGINSEGWATSHKRVNLGSVKHLHHTK